MKYWRARRWNEKDNQIKTVEAQDDGQRDKKTGRGERTIQAAVEEDGEKIIMKNNNNKNNEASITTTSIEVLKKY